jgi:hypothetical protein
LNFDPQYFLPRSKMCNAIDSTIGILYLYLSVSVWLPFELPYTI